MQSSNFKLRKIPPKIMTLLKKKAAKQKLSINSLILQIIEQDLGAIQPKKKVTYDDLDYLAGTWTEQDKKDFDQNIKFFENIE